MTAWRPNAPPRQSGRVAIIAALVIAVLCAIGVLLVGYLAQTKPEPEADSTTMGAEATAPAETAGTPAKASGVTGPGVAEKPTASDEGIAFHGLVADASGQPIADAQVDWHPGAATDSGFGDAALSVTTNAAGQYRVAAAAENAAGLLVASHGRYVGASRAVTAADATTAIDFTLSLGGAISGQVTDSSSGLGAVGITVHAFAGRATGGAAWVLTASGPGDSVETTDGGAYRLEGLVPGDYTLRVTTGDTNFSVTAASSRTTSVAAGEEVTGFDFEVAPGGTIRGRVLLADGAAAADAKVHVFPQDIMQRQMSGDTSIVSFEDKRATTDDKGWFAVRGLPLGDTYNVLGNHDSACPTAHNGVVLTEEEPEATVELQLKRGSTIYGVVTNETGAVATDATVHLMPDMAALLAGAMHLAEAGGSETPDEDGRYSFAQRPPGRYRVYVTAEGEEGANFADWSGVWGGNRGEEVELDGESDVEVDLVAGLAPSIDAVTVTGRVVDDRGTAIVGATVAGEEANTETDEDGNFALTLAATNAIRLTASAASHDSATTRVVPASPQAVLTLQRLSRISGRVVLQSGDSPSGSFKVRARVPDTGMLSEFQALAMGDDGTSGNSDGTFVLDEVKPGAVEVIATLSGHPEGSSGTLVVSPGAELTDVVVEIPAGATITGQVLTPDGDPAAGATVVAVPADASESEKMQYYYMGAILGYQGQSKTDSDGYYAIEQLSPGRYEVRATHTTFAPSEIARASLTGGAEQEMRVLQLSNGATIEGRVMRGEEPVAGAIVQASGGPGGMRQASAKPDGTFVFGGLGLGDYAVTVTDMSGMLTGKGMGMKFRSVSITAEQVYEIDIDFAGGHTLSGKIEGVVGPMAMIQVRRPGGPLPEETDIMNVSEQVEASRFIAGMAMVQRDGEYAVSGLEPGEYMLEVPWMPDNPMDFGAYETEDRTPLFREKIRIKDEDLQRDIKIEVP
ncbi:MAG: carboxypeptidase regulatory-like domain-containing protein [Planctomycetota bacterium]